MGERKILRAERIGHAASLTGPRRPRAPEQIWLRAPCAGVSVARWNFQSRTVEPDLLDHGGRHPHPARRTPVHDRRTSLDIRTTAGRTRDARVDGSRAPTHNLFIHGTAVRTAST